MSGNKKPFISNYVFHEKTVQKMNEYHTMQMQNKNGNTSIEFNYFHL